ncbi:MAG: UTP--glucose-1-phosphate uridylyltransferase [Ethanoligenens sp.]|uniref:UTP--glucose-1-phosphate uridylyltransferase n=1 Tax=Ethanoligenens sp. TaxID=2099655 RepID=UPI0039EB766C
MGVRKAIIPAAGLGTRVLPASKAIPKEMLPLVDKPAIQYIVEEAVHAGIEDILIITNRNKTVMEDHFDCSPELEQQLAATGKLDKLEIVNNVSNLADITYMRQKETLGLGHAVLCARPFAGNEPFAVLYGDDVIVRKSPAIGQLCKAYDAYHMGIAGIKQVPEQNINKYSSLAVEPMHDRLFKITDMVEKPQTPDEVLSLYSILGRCVLPPEIFDILEKTPFGADGELQLTDAMRTLTRTKGMVGVDYEGVRYDMGSKLGIMKAAVEAALVHDEIGAEFRIYVKQLAETL